MAQIATTAAGVAAGHVAGRMITGLFSGGSEGNVTSADPVQPVSNMAQYQAQAQNAAPQCQEYSKMFLSCMERNDNEVGICKDYMDMMKACQQQYAAM